MTLCTPTMHIPPLPFDMFFILYLYSHNSKISLFKIGYIRGNKGNKENSISKSHLDNLYQLPNVDNLRKCQYSLVTRLGLWQGFFGLDNYAQFSELIACDPSSNDRAFNIRKILNIKP